jgi:hypothetical protein
VFSPGGRRLAYWRQEGKEAVLQVEGEASGRMHAPEGGLYGVDDPVFSGDGRRLAWQKRRPDGKAAVVVDGKEGAPFGDVGRPVFSPNSLRWMHTAGASIGQDHDVLVVDGAAKDSVASGTTTYRFARVWPFRFDADNRPMFVAGLADGRELLVRGERVLGPYHGVTLPVRGPGGREAYIVRRSSSFYVAEPSREHGPYESVTDLAFAPDGRLAFTASAHGKEFVVLGGRKEDEHDAVGRPEFAQGRCAYWARDGKDWKVALDGRLGTLRAEKAGLLLLAAGGVPVVTYREADGWRLAVGETGYGPFDELGPTLLNDHGRLVRAGVRSGRELWRREFRVP